MSPAESLVIFHKPARQLSRRELKDYAARLREDVAGGRGFCCLIADDAELARLNRQFCGKDYATDVLSFRAGGPGGPLGDIAISLDRAREQAGERGHSIGDEVKILMLHGLLHLLGMDHEKDRGAMRRREQRLRRKLELPAGLIERARA
jgi:probable rRNA maturation factor